MESAAQEPLLKAEPHGSTLVLKLNDGRRRNPLSAALRDQLIAALDAAMQDKEVRAIVLAGEGGAFCSGGDISEMSGAVPDPLATQRRTRAIHQLMRLVQAGPKPVLVVVEGPAFGAGLSLVAAADYTVAAKNAKFCAAFGRVGVMADCGLMWTLPRRIGMGWARDMLISARVMDVSEARGLGLVHEVVEDGASALERALEKAKTYSEVAPLSIAMTKAALAKGGDAFEDVLSTELDLIPMLLMTADHAEARKAFLEKRKPVFSGR